MLFFEVPKLLKMVAEEIGRASCRERVETVSDFILGAPKSLKMVIAAMKLKDAYSLEGKLHSSVLAWRIPGTGEPGGLPSMGSHRVTGSPRLKRLSSSSSSSSSSA